VRVLGATATATTGDGDDEGVEQVECRRGDS